MDVKYIFVTGGVVSSLGKGIATASLGRLLKARGFKVAAIKFDPYINIDPGTMSPYQHGEVFVTDDGTETDLDLGHYERFIDTNLTGDSSVTTGKIYWSVLTKERRGDYLGATIQVIPHITEEIKSKLTHIAKETQAEIVIVETGGTVGDIESLPFLEAIRQMSADVGYENVLYMHLTLLPYLPKSGEIKTKPTQHSVKQLREIGIQPDIIMCRTAEAIPEEIKQKIALFCSVKPENVVQNVDADSIYSIPLILEKEGLANKVMKRLGLEEREVDLSEWKELVEKEKNIKDSVRIALVGKYVALKDAYLSIAEALRHGGIANDLKIEIDWVDSSFGEEEEHLSREEIYQRMSQKLEGVDGIILPGGFGKRGTEGMIATARYARENNVPYFGICFGLQISIVEYARNVLGLTGAHSRECDPNAEDFVIDFLPDKSETDSKGATMRLGVSPCKLVEGTIAKRVYGEEIIYERHRHRLEFNNHYRDLFEDQDPENGEWGGLVFSALSPDDRHIEVIENTKNDWFLCSQFHPEFKSRPTRPHPLFKDFVAACKRNRDK